MITITNIVFNVWKLPEVIWINHFEIRGKMIQQLGVIKADAVVTHGKGILEVEEVKPHIVHRYMQQTELPDAKFHMFPAICVFVFFLSHEVTVTT
jgi:hypothetical protein